MLGSGRTELVTAVVFVLGLLGCAGTNGDSATGDQVTPDHDVVVAECSDDLNWWSRVGACVPFLPECENPWEMPTVEGECVVVGPRACSKTWDLASDEDCDADDLLPCKEGFALTDDESACVPHFQEDCSAQEIPTLGGGCVAVGPYWGEAGKPSFDDCGKGFLSRPGGGCDLIGPRACLAQWDPEAGQDCGVGDVIPCPDGWLEAEGGLSCDPMYESCGLGERPLVGGGCVQVVPSQVDCPSGPFPALPDGAVGAVYVLASSNCSAGCGSSQAPHSSIQDAIDAAPDGGYVLVGAGVYSEGLAIDKPIHLIGLCASQVAVSGTVAVVSQTIANVDEAGIAVVDTAEVDLRGLTVLSPATGIAIVDSDAVVIVDTEVAFSYGNAVILDKGSSVEMRRLSIHEVAANPSVFIGRGYGLWVGGGSQAILDESVIDAAMAAGALVEGGSALTVEDSTIRDTNLDADGTIGVGVLALGDASLVIERTVLERNRGSGFVGLGIGTSLLVETIIRDTQADGAGKKGRGVEIFDGNRAVMESCVVDSSIETGVRVSGVGSKLDVRSTTIRQTSANGYGQLGVGAGVSSGASMMLVGSFIDGNNMAGVVAVDPGTTLELHGTIVRNSQPQENGHSGHGLNVLEGSSAIVKDSLIEANHFAGLEVSGVDSILKMHHSVVSSTAPSASGTGGMGVFVVQGGSVVISQSLITGNHLYGVSAYGEGSVLELASCVVRGTAPNDDGDGGYGVFGFEAGIVNLRQTVVDGSTRAGVFVVDAGTVAQIEDCAIVGTLPDPISGVGSGVEGAAGAQVFLARSLLDVNTLAGISASNPGTGIEAIEVQIQNTQPNDGGIGGYGLAAYGGAHVSLVRSLLNENSDAGVAAFGSNTEVDVGESVIRDTQPNAEGKLGYGINVRDEAKVFVDASLLERNRGIGVAIFDAGSTADIFRSVIRETVESSSGAKGLGVQVILGGDVSVRESLLDENTDIAILATDDETTFSVEKSVIRGTRPTSAGDFGRGVQVSSCCFFEITGSLLEDNVDGGIAILHDSCGGTVAGTIIRDTAVRGSGQHGEGIIAAQGSFLDLSWCCIERNNTAGIVAWDQGTTVSADHVLVSATANAGLDLPGADFEVFGDGVVVANQAELYFVSSMSLGNERTGAYFYEASGVIDNSIFAGNQSFGLALRDCLSEVDHGAPENVYLENASGLPPAQQVQVTSNPEGLPLPPLPGFESSTSD